MGTTFAGDLYYGRIAPWEQKRSKRMSQEMFHLNRELEQEREYLIQRLSAKEDRLHFENYEQLTRESNEREKIESFRQGLRIGALFMDTILCEKDTLAQW